MLTNKQRHAVRCCSLPRAELRDRDGMSHQTLSPVNVCDGQTPVTFAKRLTIQSQFRSLGIVQSDSRR